VAEVGRRRAWGCPDLFAACVVVHAILKPVDLDLRASNRPVQNGPARSSRSPVCGSLHFATPVAIGKNSVDGGSSGAFLGTTGVYCLLYPPGRIRTFLLAGHHASARIVTSTLSLRGLQRVVAPS